MLEEWGGQRIDAATIPVSYDEWYPPDTPKGLMAQAVSNSAIYVSWKKANGADGYLLWRAGPDGNWQLAAILRGYTTTHYLDSGLNPGCMYSYRVQAYNDVDDSKYSSIIGAMTIDTDDPTFIGQFGRVVPGVNTSAPLTIRDTDGTLVTFTLSGPGKGVLHMEDGIYWLEVSDTTTSSKLTIKTVNGGVPGDDGRFTLNNLTVADGASLGTLAAKTTDLTGNLTITGTAKSLTLGNLTGTNMLTIGGTASEKGLKLTVGQVNCATVNSGVGITSIVAVRWGDGEIVTPFLNSLKVSGKGGGDFGADMRLSGIGVAAKKNVLGNVKIAGTLSGTWNVFGKVGSIRAKAAEMFTLKVMLIAEFGGGASIKNDGIKSLTIVEAMVGSEIWSNGHVGNVRVGVMDHSRIMVGTMAIEMPTGVILDFMNVDRMIKSLVVTGKSVAKDAPVWINSTVAAGSIGKATLPKRETAVLDADAPGRFGFATVDGVKKYIGPGSVGNYVSGEDSTEFTL